MNDRRLTSRLLSYWNRVKKNDVLPDFKKNNPALIEDLWGQCFVLSIIPSSYSTYKFDYIGEKIQEMYGTDITGMIIDLKNRQFINSLIIPQLQPVNLLLNTKIPQEDGGQFPSVSGKFVKYRIIMLPFGTKKIGVTHIVIGTSYREF